MVLHTQPAPALIDRRVFLHLTAGAAAVMVLGGCGEDEVAEEAPGEPVRAFTIVAENLAWDIDQITVPAGDEVTATIVNRDQGVLHNLHVRSPGDPMSPLEAGPVTQTLRFTIDEPGSFDFLCDSHPMMKGRLHAV